MTTEREKIIDLMHTCAEPDGQFGIENGIAFFKATQAEAFEAAAKLCDDLAKNGIPHSGGVEMAFAGDCAAAIRQRAKENEK